MSRSSIPSRLREEVGARDGGQCRYCRLAQFGHGATFHINHIVPRSKNGLTEIDNLALQCPHCSLHKANRTEAMDPQTGASVPLFHPLRQAWGEHLQLKPDGTCVGLTGVGRATVEALQMNAGIPRMARLCQIVLGLINSA